MWLYAGVYIMSAVSAQIESLLNFSQAFNRPHVSTVLNCVQKIN